MGIVETLTDWLSTVSAYWWFLGVIFAISFFDSVVPIVPSETTVIIGGVAAGQGDQTLAFVIACGALGAFLGDNTAYEVGARLAHVVERQAEKRPTWRSRLDWATEQIAVRGGMLLITARFIPGGRTALTVSSGLTHQPRLWFTRWIGAAVVIWASYAALLGYIGGRTFKDNHTLAFLVAFGAALAFTGIVELVRHRRASSTA